MTRGFVATRCFVDYWTVGMCVVSTYSRLMVMGWLLLLASQATGFNPRIGITCICTYAKMEVAAFLPTCRSSPMSVPRSNVWYVSPSLQAHGCWKCPFWRPEHFATLKSREIQGSIFGSRAVWHLWAMDFSVNRLDRKPSPPRCHLQQRAQLTSCPTF